MNAGSAFLMSVVVGLVVATAMGQENSRPTAQPPATTEQDLRPEVTRWSPQSVSVNSVLELEGYRLSADDASKTTAYFIQNGVKYLAKTKGGWSTTNDALHGLQSQDLIVPAGLTSGPSQVILEIDGQRSTPITVTIVEYKLPEPKGLTPTAGIPGTHAALDCPDCHTTDEIVLTDAAGKTTQVKSDGSNTPGFDVPKDAAEGPLTIQIGEAESNHSQLSKPVTFLVSRDVLPLELVGEFMTPVAPGQWLDLQASSLEPLVRSELTEVNFKQDGSSIIVSAPNPHRPHILVPTALSPGPVRLEVRTWRNGHPSLWSDPLTIQLPDKVVAPLIEAIRLEKGAWAQLWPGPDRAKTFSATAGDVIVLHGRFPVADARKINVTLMGPGGSFELAAYELDEKANWFGDVCVKLSDTAEKGEWRIIVSDAEAGASVEVPIVISIT